MISEPEASSNLPHGFPCQGGLPGAAWGATAGGEPKLRRGQLSFGGHHWQLQTLRDPVVIHEMKHAMLMIQLVVMPAACQFVTCLCLHAKLLGMESGSNGANLLAAYCAGNLQLKAAGRGGGGGEGTS